MANCCDVFNPLWKPHFSYFQVRRKDPPPEIITAPDPPADRLDVHVPYEVHHTSQQHQRHQWSQPQKHHQNHQGRPHHNQRPRVEQWRRNNDRTRGHRKLPPPSSYKNQFTSLFQPSVQQQAVTTQKPLEESTPSSSSGGFNLGSVFNFLNPLIQNKPDIILHDSPAIKTLPAPDLTKVNIS